MPFASSYFASSGTFKSKTLRVHRLPIPVSAGRGEDGAKTGWQYSENGERPPQVCFVFLSCAFISRAFITDWA
eukprot:3781901-Pyramimonas_sp.AAC.1